MAVQVPGWKALRDVRERFGMGAALQHLLHRAINLVMYFEWLNIIVLDRERLRALDPKLTARLRSRLATIDDLHAMRANPKLDMDDEKFRLFDAGDACLISYADDKLAGYTWAHTKGCPELLPGLVIAVPRQYVYNFAALTLPEFRGLGMQPYRHHQLLDNGLWQDKRGLVGFVLQTNFPSRKGQGKSGYRKIGSIWLFGSKRHFAAVFSRSLRKLGIHRLKSAQ
ncbi:MAG TPA: hypothetical protein VMI92_00585 [Steroidobacteraceae bacterium]|nr:hypothetical protein [Steroidobacteraceae bacterium]